MTSCDTEGAFLPGNCYLEDGKIILHYSGYYGCVEFRLWQSDPLTGKKTEVELGSIFNRPLSSYLTISYSGNILAGSVLELYVYENYALENIITVERR